ncbi:hypothetical protein Ddc_02715 [Ditylenchus destructor]|nr:hypothetical protein Ddc_02715 [Ditylenchus destructor]
MLFVYPISLQFTLSLISVSEACLSGGVAVSNGVPPLRTLVAAANRNLPSRVLAAPSLDKAMRAGKCQRSDFGVYRAKELRRLVTAYDFPRMASMRPSSVRRSGLHLNCGFDAVNEPCGWYSTALPPNHGTMDNVENDDDDPQNNFQRARFETFFDLEKFDCTSDRSFPFDDYFLLFGAKEGMIPGVEELGAALEAFVPCQMDRGVLRFDYWSNNETPILKICIIAENNPTPQCEESQLDLNPLTFEIPQNLKPFRIRIQVEHVGHEDIVFIDNVHYDGKVCGMEHEIEDVDDSDGHVSSNRIDSSAETDPTRVQSRDGQADSAGTESFIQLTHSPTPTSSKLPEDESSNKGMIELLSATQAPAKLPYVEEIFDEKTAISEFNNQLIVGGRNKNAENNTENKAHRDPAPADPCQLLTCDFNYGDSCYFTLLGLGSTAEWRIGSSALGNPHTGVHRPNPFDRKMTGFAFVGTDGVDLSNEVFVLESSAFILTEPVELVFDLFQRSMGPQLKVCVNSFDNCPYSNPSLDAHHYWLINQKVLLKPNAAHKVYFIAGKVKQNLFLAIDNIRLHKLDNSDFCSASSTIDDIRKSKRKQKSRR